MAPGLCENCHKRPKFGTHRFCGKTCAARAAAIPARSKPSQPLAKASTRNGTRQKGGSAPQKAVQLCTYCGQKPKFNNFDYCGKSCAALAGAGQAKPPMTQGAATTTKQRTMRVQNAVPSNPQAPVPAKSQKVPRTKIPEPQDYSTDEDKEPEEEDDYLSTDLDAYPSDTGSESEDEPSVPTPPASKPSGKNASKGSKPGSGVPKNASGACAIPGCDQPSHVDRNGVKTKYCSVKHREEAVNLGLESACIMCQRYPQSTSDYFCSSACRNQSMTKT